MPMGAMVFLGGVLAVFAVVDLVMLVTLLRPGDERGQVVVWKASAWTLLGTTGGLVLEVAENVIRSQPMAINPLVHLEVVAILYCGALLYFRKKLGG